MYIFVDESGQFVSSERSDFAIMVIVTISDKAYDQFRSFYTTLLGSTAAQAKSTDLSFPIREKILKYVSRHQEIRYTAYIYDHRSTSLDAIKNHQVGQVAKLQESIERIRPVAVHQSLITDLELLRNQLRGLSTADYLKVILLIEALRDWVQTFTFDYFYMSQKRDSWDMHHIFDTQNKGVTFVRLVYSLLSGSSNRLVPDAQPAKIPSQWPADHPFFVKYNTDTGINMKSFFSDRRCGDDSSDVGLKLPDLISNTILRSLQRQADQKWSRLLKRLKTSRSFVHTKKGVDEYYKIIAFPSSEGVVTPSESIRTHSETMRSL